MSYDLIFWKQRKPLQSAPVEVYRKLNSRENLEGRLDLPSVAELPVEQILERLKGAYPDFDPSARLASFKTPDGHFDVTWSKKHFTFNLYGDLGDSLNSLVEMMREFGCPLFDPQENKRHDANHGLAVGEIPRFRSPTAAEKRERKQRYEAVLSQTQELLARGEKTRRLIKVALGVGVLILLNAVIWYLVTR